MKKGLLVKFLGLAAILSSMFCVTAMAADTVSTINVSGTSTIKVAPDIAHFSVGVRMIDKTAEEAAKKTGEGMKKLEEALLKAGVSKTDIDNSSINIYPTYDYKEGTDKITGYNANAMYNVTIKNLDNIGKIVDAAIGAGANIVNNISYDISDPSKFYNDSYTKAFNNANQKATAIAKAMGKNVTSVISVSEDGYSGYRPMYSSKEMAVADSGAGVANLLGETLKAPQEIEITTTIVVIFGF